MSELRFPLQDIIAQKPHDPDALPGSASFYEKAGLCGQKAWLDREEDGSSRNQPRFKNDKRVLNPQLVGTIVHAILERYHTLPPFSDLALEQVGELEMELAEAMRYYYAYRKRVPPWAFGQVLGAELFLPRTEEEKATIETALGVAPYKAVLDLVSHLDQAAVDFWFDEFRLELPGPGVYVTDHKTMGRRESDMEFYFGQRQQLLSYPIIWKTLNPDHDVKGTITNCLVGNKEIGFDPLYLPFPTDEQTLMLKQSLAVARSNADRRLKNPWACAGKYGFCYHFKVGACNRVNNG